MNFNEQKGNLFDLDLSIYSLAQCISLDCQMGAGIAVGFDKMFPGMKRYLLQMIKKYTYKQPYVIGYLDKNIYVFNLITKKSYFNKPNYNSIDKCLDILQERCIIYNIKYLGIPKLGCGLDKLQWDKVREGIIERFKHMDIDIQVRYL